MVKAKELEKTLVFITTFNPKNLKPFRIIKDSMGVLSKNKTTGFQNGKLIILEKGVAYTEVKGTKEYTSVYNNCSSPKS